MQIVVFKLFQTNILLMDLFVLLLLVCYSIYFHSQWADLQVTLQIVLSRDDKEKSWFLYWTGFFFLNYESRENMF